MSLHPPQQEVPTISQPQAAALTVLAAGSVATAMVALPAAADAEAGQALDVPCGTFETPLVARLQIQIGGVPAAGEDGRTLVDVTGASAIEFAAAIRAALLDLEGSDLSIPDRRTRTLYITHLTPGAWANQPIISSIDGIEIQGFAGGVDAGAPCYVRVPATPENAHFGIPLKNTNLFVGNGGLDCVNGDAGRVVVAGQIASAHYFGIHNTTCGQHAGYKLKTSNLTSCFGAAAGWSCEDGDQNLYAGAYAATKNKSGYHNTYLGVGAGQEDEDGYHTTLTGCDCNLNGSGMRSCCGYGSGAGLYNSGEGNNFFGVASLGKTTTGARLCAYGNGTLFNNVIGNESCGFGNGSLMGFTGDRANGFGYCAGQYASTGGNFVAFGTFAGAFASDGTTQVTAITGSVFLGNGSRAKNASSTNEIVVGYVGQGLGDNTAVFGNANTTITRLFGNVGIGDDAPTNKLTIRTGETNAYPIAIKAPGALHPVMSFGINTTLGKPFGALLVGDDALAAYALLDYQNNFAIGGYVGGTNARHALVLPNAAVSPTDTVDKTHVYCKDLAGAGTAGLAVFAEAQAVAAVGVASAKKIPVMYNGEVLGLLAVAWS